MKLQKLKTALKFFKTRFYDKKPFILTHLVTNRCNAHCQMCLWRDNTTSEMRLSEIKKLYRDAYQVDGFLYLGIWGGEPLLRQDIKEILAYAKSLGFYITFFTNGFLLPEKAPEISCFIDRLSISLDFPDERHNQARGLPNLLGRIRAGIQAIQKTKNSTLINLTCTLTQLNKDCVRGMVDFAKKNGVDIIFGGMIIDKNNQVLALSTQEKKIIGQEIIDYKKKGYPILNSNFNLSLLLKPPAKKFCAYTKLVLSINADGLINPSCVPIHNSKYYISSYPNLSAYLSSTDFQNWQKKVENCAYCQDCLLFQEANALWYLNFGALWENFKSVI